MDEIKTKLPVKNIGSDRSQGRLMLVGCLIDCQDCGDVNAIGRVHEFLELYGTINFGLKNS